MKKAKNEDDLKKAGKKSFRKCFEKNKGKVKKGKINP